MRASCVPSAHCDDVHDAKQLFNVVSLLCSIFFGVPFAIVLLRMVSYLTNPIARTAYEQLGLTRDIIFSLILAAFTFIPILYTYIRYERKLASQEDT
jgi:ABC-type methionine transport system permease subunit